MQLPSVTFFFFLISYTTAASHAALEPRLDIFSAAGSWFNSLINGEQPTSTETSTRGKPTKTVEVTTTDEPKTTQSSKTSKSTSESSSTGTSTSTTTTGSSTTLSTSTITPAPTIVPTSPASASPLPSSRPDSGDGITGGGIAVAVVLSLFVLGVIAWVIFRYHPKSRAWWAARQERKFKERSFRLGIDGVGGTTATTAAGSSAAGGTAIGRSKSRRDQLASFFAPKTVKLGNGKELKRKTVNWGAPLHPSMTRTGSESEQGLMEMEKGGLNIGVSPITRQSSATSTSTPSTPSLPMAEVIQMPTRTYQHNSYLESAMATAVANQNSTANNHNNNNNNRNINNVMSPVSVCSTSTPSTPRPNNGVPSMPVSPMTTVVSPLTPLIMRSPLSPQTARPSPATTTTTPTSPRYDKPLPELKVNGHIVHELA